MTISLPHVLIVLIEVHRQGQTGNLDYMFQILVIENFAGFKICWVCALTMSSTCLHLILLYMYQKVRMKRIIGTKKKIRNCYERPRIVILSLCPSVGFFMA